MNCSLQESCGLQWLPMYGRCSSVGHSVAPCGRSGPTGHPQLCSWHLWWLSIAFVFQCCSHPVKTPEVVHSRLCLDSTFFPETSTKNGLIGIMMSPPVPKLRLGVSNVCFRGHFRWSERVERSSTRLTAGEKNRVTSEICLLVLNFFFRDFQRYLWSLGKTLLTRAFVRACTGPFLGISS